MLCARKLLFGFAVILLTMQWSHASYIGSADIEAKPQEYGDDSADLRLLLQRDHDQRSMNALRRTRSTCVEKGQSCDHQPNSCCQPLACRCNLWGANCRCQGTGLF